MKLCSRHSELITALMRLIKDAGSQKSVVVAIDGRCGSGKTTLAAKLKEVLCCAVIHTDDFYLPELLRTPERLKQAGGNIHYERFAYEVIAGLKSGEAFSYGVFDCSSMSVIRAETVQPNAVTIIEGAYSLHPNFADIYDIKVFCDISPKRQKSGIVERDGIEKYKLFESIWIPMEELYFKTFNIRAKCDICISMHEKEEQEA